jgi:hypothetical protein
MTKTEWFPREVLPVHVGYYERKYCEFSVASESPIAPDYWDGEQWLICTWRGIDGTTVRGDPVLPWRGLTEPAA